MTAMTAATLDQLSDGRMILGIGSSGPQVAEGWHGQRFGRQIQRTREYVAVVRQALVARAPRVPRRDARAAAARRAGQGAEADDRAGAGARSRSTWRRSGRTTRALAGEIADGWIPTLFSPEHVAEFRPLLEEGAARVGPLARRLRHRADGAASSSPTTSQAARDAMRPFIALYVGGMGSREQNFYNQLVQRYGFEDAAREVQDLYLDGKREEAMAALPDELIDMVSLCGPARPRARAPGGLPRRRRRHAGRHADGVGPRRAPRAAAARRGACRRLTVALRLLPGRVRRPRATRSRCSRWAARSWRAGTRWCCRRGRAGEDDVRAAGMRFEAAPEYPVFPTRERPLKPYEAVRARDRRTTRPLVAALRPDAVVADILTLAPALAAELEGVPVATLIPHLDPRDRAAAGRRSRWARGCRGPALGRGLWGALPRLTTPGSSAGARELNETRRRLGLRAAGLRPRRDLALRWRWWRRSRSSSTRAPWPCPRRTSSGRCCGSRRRGDVALPPATSRWCWWRPSTVAGPRRTGCCARRCAGSPTLPVRVLAIWNGRPLRRADRTCPPTRGWSTGSPTRATMPPCDVVVCHGGHGTLARALACGCAVVVVPAAGDMNENAARVGLGRRRRARPAAPLRAPPGAPRGRAALPRRACASARASWPRGGARTTRRRGRRR